jgi:hypothetical protein
VSCGVRFPYQSPHTAHRALHNGAIYTTHTTRLAAAVARVLPPTRKTRPISSRPNWNSTGSELNARCVASEALAHLTPLPFFVVALWVGCIAPSFSQTHARTHARTHTHADSFRSAWDAIPLGVELHQRILTLSTHKHRLQSRVGTACRMLKQMLYRYQGQISAALVLGGVDSTGPSLFVPRPRHLAPWFTFESTFVAIRNVSPTPARYARH